MISQRYFKHVIKYGGNTTIFSIVEIPSSIRKLEYIVNLNAGIFSENVEIHKIDEVTSEYNICGLLALDIKHRILSEIEKNVDYILEEFNREDKIYCDTIKEL